VGKYFGTDGIRGKANETLTPSIAFRVGQALGIHFRNGSERRHRVVIGKDTRVSGYLFEKMLGGGFLSVGFDVTELGPLPTAGVGAFTESVQADLGVMITASHNPYKDNGIKIFTPDGNKLTPEAEARIEALLDGGLDEYLATGDDIGRARRIEDAQPRYIERVKGSIPRKTSFEGLRVVLDCANGAAYKVGPQILREFGVELVLIGVDPDGTNINEGVGAYAPAKMCAKVREVRADVGIAFDGDADRVVLSDENGKLIDGDQILGVLARALANSPRSVQSSSVVGTVMSNTALERYVRSLQFTFERTDVGDQNVLARLQLIGGKLGGEPSGHIIIPEFGPTSDGPMVALQLLSILKASGEKASKALRVFDPMSQILVNVKIKNGENPLDNPYVQEVREAAEKALGQSGRLVLRASGTEPLIRIMVECDDPALAKKIADSLADAVRAAKE
jgi:phosphoglucosamine mutase